MATDNFDLLFVESEVRVGVKRAGKAAKKAGMPDEFIALQTSQVDALVAFNVWLCDQHNMEMPPDAVAAATGALLAKLYMAFCNMHPEHQTKVASAMQNAIAGKEQLSFETPVVYATSKKGKTTNG